MAAGQKNFRTALDGKRRLAMWMVVSTITVISMLIPLSAYAATQSTKKNATSKPATERALRTKPLGRKTPGDSQSDGATPNEFNGQKRSTVRHKPTEWRMRRARTWNGDLRDLPFVMPVHKERIEREGPEPAPQIYPGSSTPSQDPSAPDAQAPSGQAPTQNGPAPGPSSSFDGLDFASWGAGHPPDTNGDVGPTYYIQTVNTSIGIFNKSTGVRVAAFTFDTFMSQGNFGNLCDTDNFGDPVVLYDSFEDRWVISDFAFKLDASGNVVNPPGNFQCIAVSKTGDPVSGGWNFYSINTTGGLGDYPKLAIWPDGIYMSVNMFDYSAAGSFQNTRLYAFNKAQLYSGSPTIQVVSFDLPSDQFTVIPSNARLQTGTPPAGSPNYFATVWNFLNVISVYKFHVDWNSISTSTLTGPDDVLMTFWWEQFLRSSATTAPTPANFLDTLYPRLMVQNQYTNLGGVESLWDSHTVGAGNPTSNLTSTQSAVRYYQVGLSGGSAAANTVQSFTYSPDTTVYRYMPSTAVDRAGNMAIGYTTSNATTNPGIKYAGRLAGDPVNSITQSEQTLFQGTGSQSGNCGSSSCIRWGDYSAMTLDPDGCTFWYTNEYYAVNGLNDLTRIGAFQLPGCTTIGNGTISGTVRNTASAPINGATVTLGSRTAISDGSGAYSFTGLPAGTYPTISAAAPGFGAQSFSSIVVNDGGTTTQDFALSMASQSNCLIDTTQADFQTGVPTRCDLTSSPGDVTLLDAPFVDQQNQTVSPTGFAVTNTSWAGQTFTPATTGKLTRIDLELFCSGCSGTNPNITVSIRNTTGATPVPTGADLVSATLPGFNDSGAGGFKTVTFSSPITLTAGVRYAIVFRSTAARTGSYAYTCSCSTTGFSNSNPYTSGQRVTSTNSGSTWTADTTTGGRDLHFQVWLDTGFPSSGNLISGIKDANPASGSIAKWGTLSWNAVVPGGSSVRFQAAASNNPGGPFNFVGPDGTSGTTFSNGGSLSQFNGSRYLKYQAQLNGGGTVTPTLNDVTVCFANKASQTITFDPLTDKTFGDPDFSVSASASSGLAVSFAAAGNCSIAGSTVHLTGVGSCTITASQGGDATFDPAPSVSHSFNINQPAVVNGTVQLVATATLVKLGDGSYKATVSIKNNGTGTAQNVVVTTAALGSATGSPLPQSIGNIPSGAIETLSVNFPGSAGASGAAVIEKYAGSYTGGTFTGSLRATLP